MEKTHDSYISDSTKPRRSKSLIYIPEDHPRRLISAKSTNDIGESVANAVILFLVRSLGDIILQADTFVVVDQ